MVEGLEIDKPSGGARPVSHTDPACCAKTAMGRVQPNGSGRRRATALSGVGTGARGFSTRAANPGPGPHPGCL